MHKFDSGFNLIVRASSVSDAMVDGVRQYMIGTCAIQPLVSLWQFCFYVKAILFRGRSHVLCAGAAKAREGGGRVG